MSNSDFASSLPANQAYAARVLYWSGQLTVASTAISDEMGKTFDDPTMLLDGEWREGLFGALTNVSDVAKTLRSLVPPPYMMVVQDQIHDGVRLAEDGIALFRESIVELEPTKITEAYQCLVEATMKLKTARELLPTVINAFKKQGH